MKRRSMKLGSGLKICCVYAPIMVFNDGELFKLFIMVWLNLWGLLSMRQKEEPWWIKAKLRPIIWLRKWHSTTLNVPPNKANPNRLEVSLKLMHLLCIPLKLMLWFKG